jgi:hypothetical protein
MPPTPTLPLPRRKPDAVRCHRHYPPGKVEDARHAALKAEFAPLLGSKLVYTRLDFLKARFAAMVAKGLIGPDEVPEEYRADA